jgi:flagellar basal body-associated protein FliL
MKKKIVLSLIAVLVLVLTYGLGYWSGFSHARKAVRAMVARDTSDSQQSSGKAEYEPYFTKQNPIAGRVK